MTTADTAEVVTTGRVFYAGHAAEAGTTLASIPAADAEVLVATGVARRVE